MTRHSSLQESINTLKNADLPDHLKSVALDLASYLEAWKEIDDRNGTESTPEQVLKAVEDLKRFRRHIDKREALKDAYAEAYPAADYDRGEVHFKNAKSGSCS